MYQGTTPALNCAVFGRDLTQTTVYVTVECGWKSITKHGRQVVVTYVDDDPETEEPYSSVLCLLTQEDTLAMKEDKAAVQVRFIDSDGVAYASTKEYVDVKDVIYPAVIQYEGGDEP